MQLDRRAEHRPRRRDYAELQPVAAADLDQLGDHGLAYALARDDDSIDACLRRFADGRGYDRVEVVLGADRLVAHEADREDMDVLEQIELAPGRPLQRAGPE